MSKCVGYGIYIHKCNNQIDQSINPYWCSRCDKVRKKTITDQLEGLVKGFDKPEVKK